MQGYEVGGKVFDERVGSGLVKSMSCRSGWYLPSGLCTNAGASTEYRKERVSLRLSKDVVVALGERLPLSKRTVDIGFRKE